MSDPSDSSAAFELRQKYKHFRILVIGRANAGKTTILKRVCNTTEDPRLYDEGKSLRGVHDVNRPFVFDSNPKFIFHDSPGFEAGGEEELNAVQRFIADRAKAYDVNEQLHAIWFCFGPDKSRPLLPLERKFFDEQRLGNAPVIAIFTKFDDLMIAVWAESRDLVTARQTAQDMLLLRFGTPLKQSRFPPNAFVCLEDMHHDDSTHQDRVKNLIEKTTDSLDNLALKILLISVQQNNLELCIQYAVRFELNKNLLSQSPVGLLKAFYFNFVQQAKSPGLAKWFGHIYTVSYVFYSELRKLMNKE
ncbi:hypothetical protein CVT26_011741 [Gymnopilus dilepis]|uniref:G domain-containing protein n=1 Tax=Gymnopilus dilepis TaxID=231916 RepID=A0A409W5X5_9AGAR|nr:hypothetical protein CVT26_011741 [Gymnopilus dilepis]